MEAQRVDVSMKNLLAETLFGTRFAFTRPPDINVDDLGGSHVGQIPKPYRGALVISADFEMAWAWRYAKPFDDPLQAGHEFAQATRRNLPGILQCCDQYQIPITWATVGHMFLDRCERKDGIVHGDVGRVRHHENDWWRFAQGDWYDHDPCSSLQNDADWYAPDLIDAIVASDTPHEIACHTFSHIDCSESVCDPDVFASEIRKCIELAEQRKLKLRSFVFPGHFVGNMAGLSDFGFDCCRIDRINALSLPKRGAHGLWEMVSTAELVFREEWSVAYHIWYYSKLIERAMGLGYVCHLWFHPSCRAEVVDKVMPGLFARAKRLADRESLLVTTMGGLVDAIQM